MKSTLAAVCCTMLLSLTSSAQPLQANSPAPYILVSVSKPEEKWGVIGVTAGQFPITTPARAASLAAFVHRQFSAATPLWRGTDIFMFKNCEAATQFAKYQTRRRNQRLTAQDYRRLSTLWPQTWVFASFTRHSKRMMLRYPEQRPRTWWHKLK